MPDTVKENYFVNMSNASTKTKRKIKNGSFQSIFMHADGVDMFLMALGFLGAFGDGFSSPLMLLVLSRLMNGIGDFSSVPIDVCIDKINENAVNLCYLAIGIWVACFLEGYCWARTAERQASRLRSTYLKAVLRQEVAYFDQNSTSTTDIVTSVTSDSLLIQEVISEKVPVIVMNISIFVGAYFVGFILMWRLTIVALPFIIVLVIPGLIYGKVLMSLSSKMREEYNNAGMVAEQAISSVRTVYSFAGENKTIAEFSAALQGTLKLGLKQGLAKGVTIGSNGVSFAVFSFMTWYGSRMVMYHGAKGGTVFAVCGSVAMGGLLCVSGARLDGLDAAGLSSLGGLGYAGSTNGELGLERPGHTAKPLSLCVCLTLPQMLYNIRLQVQINSFDNTRALGSGLSNVKYLSDAIAASERIREVIKRVPEIDSDNTEGQILHQISGELEFKHVTFSYPSRPESVIFKDFNLRVPAGKTVALVGGSGSGKSTAIALLQRFYDPHGGEILVDGVRIDRLQLKWWRSQMGLVSQEPALFATSIKENIIFGKEDAVMEEVLEAAKASNAHDFISQLPLAYDTQVGERGVQMSGGQKQRIAIARALIKSPRILLLDEATSALDSESERVVQAALDQAAVGRTTIIVAHRLSTIRNADLIAVVTNGHVVEFGPHEQLIRLENGAYTALVRLQETKPQDEPTDRFPPGPSPVALDVHNTSQSVVSWSSSANSVKHGEIPNLACYNNVKDQFISNTANREAPVPSVKRLLAMNAPEWREALFGSLGAVLFGAVQPVYAFTMGSMISVYFLADHHEIKHKTMVYGLCFVGLAVFSMVINVVQHYNFAAMGERLTKRVRERMLAKILTFEIGWFDRDENSSGAICSRLAKDASVVRSLVGDRIGLLIQTFSAVTIACTIGLVIAWRLAVVMIAVQPIIIICFYLNRVLLKKMSQKATKSQDESSKLAAEAVSNLRTVTAFSSQSRILEMFHETQKAPTRESARQSWYAGIGLGFSKSLTACILALDFWYGGKLIGGSHLTAKAFFRTYMVLVSTGKVIADAGTMTNDLAKGSDAVSSVFAVLDRHTMIEPDDSEGKKPKIVTGRVELCDVYFAYPARPDVVIFNGFSIDIEPGKSTALVGQSGSGKSTIIGLIERFYDPIKGVVKIDGQDIKSYHLRTLRKHIALVSQEPTLFAGTVRENIRYGASEEVTESEVVEAAKAANAHGFITGLKDGYDTWCGDRGVQLSGGQKQRVAISRAMLKNPAILLLDEATSALDSLSEQTVQEALERMMVGRTSVVVAHRLSTIQSCDTIAVLEKGKVVEKGNHGSLLSKGPCGAYYTLVRVQKANSG
ncbi:hypothetical protein OSB04_015473 [Centaurea solstitialis]|uniref:Uncharacterized protein n=1 Tax=Centaurea solstitialis TaxID=347529 RepID=A0AA38SZB1_9ASTR|nr:hypothetical protein OSB04_015473 [Centaurea solstitialis]